MTEGVSSPTLFRTLTLRTCLVKSLWVTLVLYENENENEPLFLGMSDVFQSYKIFRLDFLVLVDKSNLEVTRLVCLLIRTSTSLRRVVFQA